MSAAGPATTSFEAHAAAANETALRMAPIIGAVSFPAGALIDLQTYPDKVWDLLWIRLACAALCLCALPLSRASIAKRYPRLLAAAVPVLGQGSMLAIVATVGGYDSPYYAGLNAVILVFCLLYVWPWSITAWFCAGTIVAWLLPSLPLIVQPGFRFDVFANNLFFLSLTSILAIATTAARFRIFVLEYEARSNLARASEELAGTLQRLQQLDRFKSEFFANITHELRTPLTMILAPLELMIQGEMGSVSEAQRGSLQAMLRSGIKLLKLIGDLLDLSRLTESRLRLRVAEHDLVAFLRSLTAQVEPLMQRKSIALHFESNVDRCDVHCDLERLERVFINLLSNASKFTSANGRVDVSMRDDGSMVRVEVKDDGIGFPQDKAEALFERFYQVDMAGTRKFGGTGIGLSLARELVELHGGEVSAHSGSEGGATFVVELPKGTAHLSPERIDRRARADDRLEGKRETDHGVGEWQVQASTQFRLIDIEEATEQRIVHRDADEQSRNQTVLVVEDSPDVIRVINLALHSRFRVLAALGGAKGIDLAIQHRPDLIITDLMMPEVDGMELTRRLREDPRTRHIPVVMLTARSDLDDRVAGLDAGVNAYLTKPFSAQELVSTVRGLVKIQEATADVALTHSMDSLETIAGGLAHEINNPLNYIKNAVALIRADTERLLDRDQPVDDAAVAAMSARARKMFGVAEIGLKRVEVTVSLLQRYAREGYTRTKQPYDVFSAARDVVDMLQSGMDVPVVQVVLEGGAEIECVPEEMNQVLTNVVQNALDAIAGDVKGAVRVGGRVEGAQVVLSVRDNGPGIAPSDRAKIFTPFFTTKDVGKGMGLGLSIVRRVVQALGGTVDLRNLDPVGCEVTLRLPLVTTTARPTPPQAFSNPLSDRVR